MKPLSASSTSHRCLRLDVGLPPRLAVLRQSTSCYFLLVGGLGEGLIDGWPADVCDLVFVQTGAARAGLRCNNGKPTFKKRKRKKKKKEISPGIKNVTVGDGAFIL